MSVSKQPGVFIDNKLQHGSQSRTVLNPATEEPLGTFSTGGVEHIDAAVQSSLRAFAQWSTHDNGKARGQALRKFSELVEANRKQVERAVTLAAGKPGFEAELEVTQVRDAFAFFAGVTDKVHGEVIPFSQHYLSFTDAAPLGVIGCISPW